MARRKKGNIVNGWINLDKPLEMTSTQAVGRVRRILNAQKVGHAGTLDPLATGILPIALGEATKTIPYCQDALKSYLFTVTWGEARDTDDAEGDVIATSDNRPTPEQIDAILPGFVGDIEQMPPKFSAIKINGERAYDLAREGEDVVLEPRPVYIESLEIIAPPLTPPQAGGKTSRKSGGETATLQTTFRCECGKGTYIRSLARDFAARLGTVGYVSMLRRESVGPFNEKNAISLEKLEELSNSAPLDTVLLPVQTVLDDIPALAVNDQEAARLKQGQKLSFIAHPDIERLKAAGIDLREDSEALVLHNDRPLALVTVMGPEIKPDRVFNM